LDVNTLGRVLAEPVQVLLSIRCIDDDEITFLASIDDEVVDDAPVLIAEQVVLRLPDPELVNLVGHQTLKEPLRRLTGESESTHVGDVEDARDLTHGEMLVADRAVLLWHLPPAEIHHPAAERKVAVEERGA